MNRTIGQALSNPKIRSFWKRPEGRVAIIVGAILALLILLFFTKIVKIAGIIIANLFFVVIGATVLVLIVLTLAFSKSRKGVFTGFRKALKVVASIFAEINPFRKLQKSLRYLIKNSKELSTLLTKSKSIKGELKQKREELAQKIERSKKLEEMAKISSRLEMTAAQKRELKKLEEKQLRYQDMDLKLDNTTKLLAEFKMEAQEDIVDILEESKQMWKNRKEAGRKMGIGKRFKVLFDEDSDDQIQIDNVVEAVYERLKDKLNSLEKMIDILRSFLSSVNLDDGSYEREGLELIDDVVENIKNDVATTDAQSKGTKKKD